MNGRPVEPTVDRGNRIGEMTSSAGLPGSSAGSFDGRPTMSTNARTLHRGSVQYVRGGLAALLALILLAAAAIFALNTASTTGTVPAPLSNAEIQKALIDVRAGERAPLASVPSAAFWVEFRAAEREMR